MPDPNTCVIRGSDQLMMSSFRRRHDLNASSRHWPGCVVTADEFRHMALSLPQAVESAHMGHPDFRVRGKIFATLWPDQNWGMVKLAPDQQGQFVRDEPEVFSPVKGGWG